MNLYKNFQNKKKDEEVRKNDVSNINLETNEESNTVIVYERTGVANALVNVLKIIGQTVAILLIGLGIAVAAGFISSIL